MRKISMVVAFLLMLSLFSSSVCYASDVNSTITGVSSVSDPRDDQINKLFDDRMQILMKKPVNIEELNVIDIQLVALGVTFMTEAEVNKQFPDAKAQRQLALSGLTIPQNDGVISPNITQPSSSVNTWASYRTSNYLYNGQYYNIQRLIAEPIDPSSGLWEEGARTINYSVNWRAVGTTFIQASASLGAGFIPYLGVVVAVYDALKDIWSSITSTTEIDPGDVYYEWQTSTIAEFAYVRLESQTDNYQWLSHISTKCETSVAYIVRAYSYRQSSTGAWTLHPNLQVGSKMIYQTPTYYNSLYRAVWAYNNGIGGAAYHDSIYQIQISGPESKVVSNISPCRPQFPSQCE